MISLFLLWINRLVGLRAKYLPWHLQQLCPPLLPRLWAILCVRRIWTLRSWRQSRSDWSSTLRNLLTGCCGWCSSWFPSPSSAWSSSSESSPDSDDDNAPSWTQFYILLCLQSSNDVGLHRSIQHVCTVYVTPISSGQNQNSLTNWNICTF